MSHYGTSAARRFDTAEEFDFISRPQQKKEPVRLKVVKKQQTASAISFKSVITFVAAVICVCVVLYNQVQINEVNREISKINSQITQLESENVKMQSSLETSLSIRNVTKQAEQELGMQRIAHNQIIDLRIYEDDKVEIANQPNPEGISETVETFAARVVRYFEGTN